MNQTINFLEVEPTIKGAIKNITPTKDDVSKYGRSLFPCLQWLPRYNWRWLLGDVIAGLTAGLVVIPQAMAYAILATLRPDFGLYTSFAGAATYWIFGTSKDIVIGTTAVGSLLVGEVIAHVNEARPGVFTSVDTARTLSFMTGLILLAVGLLRLGWVVEVIPYIPISAFITAASITIMCTQLSALLGIPNINTREKPYRVLINTLKRIGSTQLDASIGITCLILLEFVRAICTRMEVRQPNRKRLWSTISSLRLTFAMLLYTLVSWLVNRHFEESQEKFRIVGHIDKGFVYAGPPLLDTDLINLVLPRTPIIIIILLIEHIAIAKNFGKQFGYEVVPSQEILSQGTANVLGPFLGGYSCTGSFGASAVLSKAGVKTPLAGLISALVLLLALHALTSVFFYIPRAALAGIIIHAVVNLLATPATVAEYWHLSPIECIIWIIGVVVAIFLGLETSIYITISLSAVLLLVRIARTKVQLLREVIVGQRDIVTGVNTGATNQVTPDDLETGTHRHIYLSLMRQDASNPEIIVASPHPGVFIYHFPEGLNYLNQAMHFREITKYVYTHTTRTTSVKSTSDSDTLWCNPPMFLKQDTNLPTLQAIVIDCSSIHHVDTTSVLGLTDVRKALDAWASPSKVSWYFGGLRNPWARKTLAFAGFGRSSDNDHSVVGHGRPALSIARPLDGAIEDNIPLEDIRRSQDRIRNDEPEIYEPGGEDFVEQSKGNSVEKEGSSGRKCERATGGALIRNLQPVFATDRPFFLADLDEAVAAAIRGTNSASTSQTTH